MKNPKQVPFWFLTISIFTALIVPALIQDGMFMDGVLYTSVSKNLANGIGSFWFPEFSETWVKNGYYTFHEHPPLVFGIQAIFFKIFGNSLYTERIYSFLTACITAYFIVKTWQLVTKEYQEIQNIGWLAVFLWIIIPVCFWAYQNNIQENTMGVFTLLSVYFSLKALFLNQKNYINIIISGVFIFLASFSKGVPGLFPIGVIGLYWIVNRSYPFSKVVIYTFILIAVPVLIYSLLLLNNEAAQSLNIYFYKRLLARVESAPVVDSHFFILGGLFMELLPIFIVAVILFVVYRIKSIKPIVEKSLHQKVIFFILVGLSGSLPLMFTLVQRRFYFVHSLPFFAIGLALLIAPGLSVLLKKINTSKKSFNLFKIISIILLVIVITISALQTGKVKRHKKLLHDIYLMEKIIPHHTIIGTPESMWNNWSLQCYLIRYFNISVQKSTDYDYYLIEKKMVGNIPSGKFEKIPLKTKEYDLYKLKK